MTITKVSFSKTFPIGLCYEKIFLEAEITEEDDPRQCLYTLKKKVEDFFYESNKAMKKEHIEPESPSEDNKRPKGIVEGIIYDIQNCTNADVLETYKFLIKKYPQAQKAYEMQEAKLIKKLSIVEQIELLTSLVVLENYKDLVKTEEEVAAYNKRFTELSNQK